MSRLYVLKDDGEAVAIQRVHCKDETSELQEILFQNHDLLPGNQIRPEDPRRWLLIRREMPVEDPATGSTRWSIDFFFVDQDGIPTFVECKRFNDTRSRREIVGQMLEYAANGHFYWDKENLRMHASGDNRDLEEAIRSLRPEDPASEDEFLEMIELNLREGQVRLIFFLEEAPWELRSIADFLNRQMERSEVLIVEAKQYELDGRRIIQPSLFGYTEEARRVKRRVTEVSGARRNWDKTSFLADASAKLDPSEVREIERIHSMVLNQNLQVRWGTGKHVGSMQVVLPGVSSRSVISIYSDGRLYLNAGWFAGSEQGDRLRVDLIRQSEKILASSIAADAAYPVFPIQQWAGRAEAIVEMLKDLHTRYSSRVDAGSGG